MEKLRLYTEEEQFEGIVRYSEGMRLVINGDKRAVIEFGDKVTIIGEFTIDSQSDSNKKLKQLIFASNKELLSMHEGFIEAVPKEKLELGDFVRVVWNEDGAMLYEVRFDKFQHSGYYLHRVDGVGRAFDADHDTTKDLMDELKTWSFVESYEIFPKGEYELVSDIKKK